MIVIHRKITWLLLFSIFSLIMASWLICVSEGKLEKTNTRINQTHEIIGMIRELTFSVAGSGQTYSAYRPYMDSLQQLAARTNDQRPQMSQLRQYLQQPRTASLDTTLHALLFSMMQTEKKLLDARISMSGQVNRRTAYGLLIGRAGAFVFVAIVLFLLNKDITRRKQIQEHLERAISEARQAKQMQEQFLANMSHEIRTPMNGIKGMTELLLDTPLSPKQHELAGTIKSSAGNLLVIINDILDFSKIQAGKLNIEKIEFSLRDILHSTASIFEHRLKKKGLHLHIDIDAEIPGRLIGDPYRLNQVLINLLGNAIKFTEQGQIQIRAAVVKRSDQDLVLAFDITDTGIGISTASLPHIFDSFSQAGEGKDHRYGGTGLGLTICKQLLHLQGGEITAASTPGQGSTFHFHLPYGYTDKPVSDQPVAVPLNDYSNLLAGRRFLVAEDNEINQRLIDYVLTKAGGTVRLANNGVQAIDFLRDDQDFDLIIMDLQMPEMDGYATTQYIRKDLHMHIPIIAMTATAMKGEQLQCLQSGMNEYMTKPFEFADLYKRINSLLNYGSA
ncbi:ATP-binding protein [Flavitalea sp. BT771]|uniref:ATP-binding protein n=1 Tax=Flavitalea sp. BT771 TaxID=3063329 RepID=UPI0026E1852A|nr:ATP-binding protein [Flavitalea sp. BT771]MDO6429926.1 ATP-binding protein [Flavitalea sp. BT771]MDV6217946.1 ATP-binding protein [Flavitalea sp. BT771]